MLVELTYRRDGLEQHGATRASPSERGRPSRYGRLRTSASIRDHVDRQHHEHHDERDRPCCRTQYQRLAGDPYAHVDVSVSRSLPDGRLRQYGAVTALSLQPTPLT